MLDRGKKSAPPKPKDPELSAARIETLETKTGGLILNILLFYTNVGHCDEC
jgi:hypothetical protein